MTVFRGHMAEHWRDAAGNPAGGVSAGVGFTIAWKSGSQERLPGEPHGALVADVLEAVLGRLAFYQATPCACGENIQAMEHVRAAMEVLRLRSRET